MKKKDEIGEPSLQLWLHVWRTDFLYVRFVQVQFLFIKCDYREKNICIFHMARLQFFF